MGLSWSSSSNNNRRRNNNYFQNPTPTPLITSYTSDLSPIPPPPPLPPPPNYNVPYPTPPYPPPPNSYPTPLPPHPPLPPPHQPYYYQYSNGYNNSCGFMGPPMLGRSNFSPHYANLNNGWPGIRPFEAPPRPPVPPPPHVENQMAKKIRNDVNVHKDTIKIVADENNPDCHLVSFTFDALVDGSITIFYFAKEESDCIFTPLYPEVYTLVRIPFHKGRGQKFCQPSGTGIDLGFFELDDLSKSSPTEDVFPLVIFAETCSPFPTDEHLGQPQPSSSNAQITQAIIEKNNDNPFQAKVVKQILWVDRVRYELRDIYGIGNSAQAGSDSNEPANCVICMSEPKDTAVMPCRHMCMCSGCSKVLRLRTNKCPICRQPIEELLEIKVNNGDR